MAAYRIDPENPSIFSRKMFEAAFPHWFEFGRWPTLQKPTHVDIFDGNEDRIVRLPIEKMDEVIALRDKFLADLEEIIRR